jgi:uncharacterized protein (TIRG00374 family)
LKSFFEKYLLPYHPLQKLGVLAILGVAVQLILPQITALEHSWNVLKSMLPWAVCLAFLAQTSSYIGNGYLLQSILKLTNTAATLWRSTLIVLGAASVGMVAGGMVGSSAAIYRWTSRESEHPEGAVLAGVLPSLFNNLVLVLVSLFGLIHLLITHNLSQAQLIGFSVTLLTLGTIIGLGVWALQHRDQATASALWISARLTHLRRKPFEPAKTTATTNSFFSAWDTLRNGAWHGLIIGAVSNVLFDMLTLYFLFIAAGHDVSPGVLIAGYGLPLLLGKMAFVVPGGVGVVEGSMAALYNGLGVPNPITVVVVLGYRLISFWLPSFSGFPIAAYLQQSRKVQNG